MTLPAAPPSPPSTDALLRALVDATATVTGQAFFDALTCALGTALNASNVALSQLIPGRTDRVETVSCYSDGKHVPNFTYDLDVTPCKNVLGKTFTHYPDMVAELFPNDHFFAETNTRSYIGVPLCTPDHQPLGLITLCHDHATPHLAHLKDVLTLFAGRAAAEISRLNAERALRSALSSLDEEVRDRTAALRRAVDQRAATEYDLASVTSRIPCMLWQADAEGLAGWEGDVDGVRHLFRWNARIIDESAAQRVLPLEVPPGGRYWDAWNDARHPDDSDAIFASTAQALIMGLPRYSREFRCVARDGEVRWLHEEIAVEPLAENRWQLFGVVTDVTARKLAEVALRESEQRFRAMADSAPVMIWVTDPEDRSSWFNKPWRDFIGAEAIDRDVYNGWENALHPEDEARTLRDHRANFAARVPFRLEYRLRRHDGQYRWLLDHAVPRFHPDGTFAGYLGSCVDITERKRAELELAAVTGRVPCILWRATGQAPDGWRGDPGARLADFRWEHRIIDEGAAQRLLPIDVAPGARYHDAWGRHLHPDDREVVRRTTLDALVAGRTDFDREYRVRDRDGRVHWLHEDVYVEPRGADRWDLFGVVTDITSDKLAELALRKSESRYDFAARAGRVGIWDWDIAGSVIYLSDNLKALLGYPADFPLERGDTWHEHLHPDDVLRVYQATCAHLDGQTPVYEIEVRRRHRDGSWRWFLSRGTATRDPATGEAVRMTGSLTDITDRKRAEEALRESESRYALATMYGRVGIWEWNIPSETLHLSDSLKAILGYSPDELVGMDRLTWRNHLHPDDLSRVLAATDAVLAGDAPGYELEVRRRHKDGSWRWILSRASLTREAATGGPLRMTGVVSDINDRKLAEEALRTSETRYALATQFGGVGVWEWHIPSDTLYLSDSLKALLGYAAHELNVDRFEWRAYLHPDDLLRVLEATESLAAGRTEGYSLEVRRRHKDGTYRWFSTRASVTRDPVTNEPIRMAGSLADITDRKRAEEALRESQRRYALATEAGRVGTWEYDAAADTLYLSPNLVALLGYRAEEVSTYWAWERLIHPDDIHKIDALRNDPTSTSFEFEVRRRHKDGSYRWFLSRGTITRRRADDSEKYATGSALRVTGTQTDITDRKLAAEALRESESRFTVATEAGRVGVWEYDVGRGTFLHSPNCLALLGYEADELTTHEAWAELVHPDDRAAIAAIREPSDATSFELEVRRRHKDGSWRWFLSRGTVTRDPVTRRAVRMTGAHTDITDRKRAGEALRTSEARYALATDAGGVGIWEYDVDADVLYLSPNLPAMLGYAPGEIRDMRAWRALIHPDDLPGILAANEDPNCTQFESEVRRRHKDGTYRWLLSRGTKARDANGRLIRITGTHTDITDRKRDQEALRTSEARYALATEAGGVGTLEYDVDADTLYLSPNLKAMLGYASDELRDMDAWRAIIHPDDLPRVVDACLAGTALAFEFEVRRRHKDGSWRWILSRGTFGRDAAGRATRITGIFTDVTDRKRDQEALRASEARYALATEAGAVGIWEVDYASGSVYVSQKLAAMLGRRESELRTLDAWYAITHPDDAIRTRALCHDPLVTHYEIEVRHRHADESWHWFLCRGTIDRRVDGTTCRITGTLTDITERKRAADALRESQHRFDIAVAAGRVGIIDWDIPTDRLFISPALKSLLGYAEHELPDDHKLWHSLLHPDDAPRVRALTQAYLEGQTPLYETEVRRLHRNGSYRWFLSRGTVSRDPDGSPRRFTATLTDITDRRRAEEALRDSQRRYAIATEAGGVGIWDHDYVAATFYLSPNLKSMLGYRPDELATVEAWQAILHPDDLAVVQMHNRECRDTTFELEVRRRHKDGSYRWFISRGIVAYDAVTGRRTRITGVLADITDRKRADEALRTSEEHFRTVIEQSPLATFIFTPGGDYVRSNQAAAEMYGFTADEMVGYNVIADANLADNGIAEAYRRAREGYPAPLPEVPVTPTRGRLIKDTIWIRGSVYPLRDPATGQVLAIVAINEDITERKRVESALLASERRFRKLVEQSPLSTQFFAPDGTTRAANRAWERLFGVTIGEIAGYNLLEDPQLIDAGIVPLLKRGFEGEPTPLPMIPYVPPFGEFAGQERWCSALIFPVKDAAGRVEEVVLIHHDMTEQKRAEDALRASEQAYRVAADSNKRLLLELDHRVRNNLAGLQSLTSLMRDRAITVEDFAAAMDARLRAMSHVHHLLSESQWQDLDLRALFDSFLTHTRHLAPYPTSVCLDGPAVALPAPLVLPLAMILTEFLTNSAKYGAHSVPAGRVSLTWAIEPASPQSLCIRWVESGGPRVRPNPVPSLGSALIESFSTRELGGSCSLTYPPAGACHALVFPIRPHSG